MPRGDWDSLERAAERGPGSIAVWVIGFVLAVSSATWVLSWFGDAADTAKKQFSVSQSLIKYEWFKNAKAQLDARHADIQLAAARVTDLEKSIGSTPRIKWARTDLETWSQLNAELSGIKMSYNALAAEYNSNMAKVNFRYANVGELPQGGEAMPREMAPYTTK